MKNGHHGMHIAESHNNEIEENETDQNEEMGILLGDADNNNLTNNTSKGNGVGGFYVFPDGTGNTFEANEARANGDWGYIDFSSGGGTEGTANTYIDNFCQGNGKGQNFGSDPDGLCSPQN